MAARVDVVASGEANANTQIKLNAEWGCECVKRHSGDFLPWPREIVQTAVFHFQAELKPAPANRSLSRPEYFRGLPGLDGLLHQQVNREYRVPFPHSFSARYVWQRGELRSS